jgi:hypothetical protein
LVPFSDDMTRVNNQPNLLKLNSYRSGVAQPVVNNLTAADPIAYCSNLYFTAVQRLAANMGILITASSPDPNIATNYFAYIAQRFANTFGIAGLDCAVSCTIDLVHICRIYWVLHLQLFPTRTLMVCLLELILLSLFLLKPPANRDHPVNQVSPANPPNRHVLQHNLRHSLLC